MPECEVTPSTGSDSLVSPGPRDLTFQLYAFRFQFKALDSIYFPPGKSGNIVRGAFGTIFKQITCISRCHDTRTCESRGTCTYARIFEPVAQPGETPGGLRDWPRPFVFRAAHLDGRIIERGRPFHFDVHLYDLRDPAIVYFVLAFAQLASDGIGPRRGRAVLSRVDEIDVAGRLGAQIYDGRAFRAAQLPSPITLNLAFSGESVSKIRVRFLTPTELKHGQALASRPEFGILLARIRDRISTLRALYGDGALDLDFKSFAERAELVRMNSCKIDFTEVERKSARTGERHPLGGFVGEAEYEGELGEFMPWLRAAPWVGVGRQTVWGKGVLDVTVLA